MCLLFSGQVLVGQALPLSFQRPPTILSQGLIKYVCAEGAAFASWAIAALMFVSIFNRKWQYWSAILYSFFKISMAYAVWSTDYYVSLYMLMFAFAGIALAASSKGAKE